MWLFIARGTIFSCNIIADISEISCPELHKNNTQLIQYCKFYLTLYDFSQFHRHVFSCTVFDTECRSQGLVGTVAV